jgi:hypothetical protein
MDIPESPAAATIRVMLRPMRPNPLMPIETLIEGS